MESAIHCSNLKKSYGSFTLDINDLHIATGTVHGLIGANGCGKTHHDKTAARLVVS